jgi:hypothetical protein
MSHQIRALAKSATADISILVHFTKFAPCLRIRRIAAHARSRLLAPHVRASRRALE